jgi:agmatine/peptidylarginine deiminase
LVTEECLLHPSRNPHYGKAGIEAMLKEYLGLEKIIWLWKGVAGDDSVVNGELAADSWQLEAGGWHMESLGQHACFVGL